MYSHGRDVDESMKPSWNNFGVVETIFEDEDADLESLSSSLLSFTLSSPSSPLQTGVNAWTLATGIQPDVKIHVRGVCFHLHKDLIISKSNYLKRHLIRVSELSLSPPLNLAADTFKQVADFWYTNHAAVTPSNVAALRTASELLETRDDGVENLREITESYLCNLLHNKEFTCKVFQSSLSLLPEAEQTAFITSRCLEAMYEGSDVGDGHGIVGCEDGLKMVSPEEFRVIVESMQRRFTRSHDLLYRVVDLYFLVYNKKTVTEEQKTEICSCIDCSILSSTLVMHAVQNPRMPLRFVVQAMLIEQLTTHRSIVSALNTTKTRLHQPESPATLGAFLERDAALRQVAHMRAAVHTTCSRIHTLEKELSFMKKLLGDQHKEKHSILLLEDGTKSSSCRFDYNNYNNKQKVERGERGSVSSSMVRLFGGGDSSNTEIRKHRIDESSSSLSSYLQSDEHQSPKANVKKSFGKRLIKGLKSAFGVSNKIKKGGKSGAKDHNNKVIGYEYDEEETTFDSFDISNSVPHHMSVLVS